MALLNVQTMIGSEFNHKLLEGSLKEHLHMVSQEDLYLDDQGIQVNINGVLHPVSSLKRMGNQWLANLNLQYDPQYQCPWGHSLCAYCHMCHKVICPEYMLRCSASK